MTDADGPAGVSSPTPRRTSPLLSLVAGTYRMSKKLDQVLTVDARSAQ